ncbi:DUF1326 domain-containing protein [Parasphingorhabdus pacifica]
MSAPSIEQWRLRGTWFDACKCEIPCPCSFARPPTYGDCEGVLLWQLNEGNYGSTRLDDLNVAMLGSFIGNVWGEHSDAHAAVFLDERADQQQRAALQLIFGGQAGGWPQQFTELFGAEVLGVEFGAIESVIDDDLASWRVRIPGRFEVVVEALTGPTADENSRVQVHNLPGSEVGPDQPPATWGKAIQNRVGAFGYDWDYAGRSSKLIPFDWSGPDRT